MRLQLLFLVALTIIPFVAQAQSVADDLPPFADDTQAAQPPTPPQPAAQPATVAPAPPAADPFTVSDVNADVTADTAAHARDQALLQAEHAAFAQLCTKMGAPDSTAKIDDNTLAGLVASFEVQSEHISAVRYIGVFTIRFKPISTQKKIGKSATAVSADPNAPPPVIIEAKPMPQGPLSQLLIGVQSGSLAAWTQIKRRINTVPQVATIDTVDVGRGVSHINLFYAGSLPDLQQALTTQGLVLRQTPTGIWELYDGSMVSQ